MDKFRNYLGLIFLHIILGALAFQSSLFATAYSILILIAGVIYIVRKQNRSHEALLVAAYITGAEVFLRAAHGVVIYEYGKYSVAIVIVTGIYYTGFSKNATAYWLLLLLMIPGVVIANEVLSASIENRKIISFVISGPLCLCLCSLYTYQRKVSLTQLYDCLLLLGMPVISLAVYVIIYNPTIRDTLTGTGSNSETSGGFGPNQVATALGLGLFVFLMRAVLKSPDYRFALVNLAIASIMAFRGLTTFSRGGILTAVAMIIVLLFSLYIKVGGKGKIKLHYAMAAIVLVSIGVWAYSLAQTNGLIGNRYSNKDAMGRVKESRFTGREDIAQMEINAFLENPVFGVGVGKTIDMREEESGVNIASHDEITRMLAEHGSLGVAMLFILIFTPIILHFDNRQNFFMYPLLIFWFLTINHAAMRIAAPAFVYSLCLLKVYFPGARTPVKRAFPGMIRPRP